jgi:hypothetical protein
MIMLWSAKLREYFIILLFASTSICLANCFSVMRLPSNFWQSDVGTMTGVRIQEFPIGYIQYTHAVPNPATGHDEGFIQRMMDDMRQNGFSERFAVPLIHMPDRSYYCGGHHRVEAMKRLGESTIPAVIFEWNQMTDPQKRYCVSSQPSVYGPWYQQQQQVQQPQSTYYGGYPQTQLGGGSSWGGIKF